MRANQVIFAILSIVFGAFAVTYAIWAMIAYNGQVEWVGTVGLTLVSIMALFIGFYSIGAYSRHRLAGLLVPVGMAALLAAVGIPNGWFAIPPAWVPTLFGGAGTWLAGSAVRDLEERARHLALATTGVDDSVAGQLEAAAGSAARRGAIRAAADLSDLSARLTSTAAERAQRVLAAVLDAILRLVQPVMPFVAESVWQALAEAAPERGLPEPARAADSVVMS